MACDQPSFETNPTRSKRFRRFVPWSKSTESLDAGSSHEIRLNPIVSSIIHLFSSASSMDHSDRPKAATAPKSRRAPEKPPPAPRLKGMEIGVAPRQKQTQQFLPPPPPEAVAAYRVKPLPSLPLVRGSWSSTFSSEVNKAFGTPKGSFNYNDPTFLWRGDESGIAAILDVSPEEMKTRQAVSDVTTQNMSNKVVGSGRPKDLEASSPLCSTQGTPNPLRESVSSSSDDSTHSEDRGDSSASVADSDENYTRLFSDCSSDAHATQLESNTSSWDSSQIQAQVEVPDSFKIVKTVGKLGSQRSQDSRSSGRGARGSSGNLSEGDVPIAPPAQHFCTGENLSEYWLLPPAEPKKSSKAGESATASVVTTVTITPENLIVSPDDDSKIAESPVGSPDPPPRSVFDEDDSDEEQQGRHFRLLGRHRTAIAKVFKRDSASMFRVSASPSIRSTNPSTPSTPSAPSSPLTSSSTFSIPISIPVSIFSDRRRAADRAQDSPRYQDRECASEQAGRPSVSSSFDGPRSDTLTPTSTSSVPHRNLGIARHHSVTVGSQSGGNKVMSSLAARTGELARHASLLGNREQRRRENLKSRIRVIDVKGEHCHNQCPTSQQFQENGLRQQLQRHPQAPTRPSRPPSTPSMSSMRQGNWI